MANSGEAGGSTAAPSASPAAETASHGDSIAGDTLPAADMHAEPILGDTIADGDAGGDLADLHAALASLSNDSFAYLDIALDHLTSSSDLFDVPAMDAGHMPDDLSSS